MPALLAELAYGALLAKRFAEAADYYAALAQLVPDNFSYRLGLLYALLGGTQHKQIPALLTELETQAQTEAERTAVLRLQTRWQFISAR